MLVAQETTRRNRFSFLSNQSALTIESSIAQLEQKAAEAERLMLVIRAYVFDTRLEAVTIRRYPCLKLKVSYLLTYLFFTVIYGIQIFSLESQYRSRRDCFTGDSELAVFKSGCDDSARRCERVCADFNDLAPQHPVFGLGGAIFVIVLLLLYRNHRDTRIPGSRFYDTTVIRQKVIPTGRFWNETLAESGMGHVTKFQLSEYIVVVSTLLKLAQQRTMSSVSSDLQFTGGLTLGKIHDYIKFTRDYFLSRVEILKRIRGNRHLEQQIFSRCYDGRVLLARIDARIFTPEGALACLFGPGQRNAHNRISCSQSEEVFAFHHAKIYVPDPEPISATDPGMVMMDLSDDDDSKEKDNSSSENGSPPLQSAAI